MISCRHKDGTPFINYSGGKKCNKFLFLYYRHTIRHRTFHFRLYIYAIHLSIAYQIFIYLSHRQKGSAKFNFLHFLLIIQLKNTFFNTKRAQNYRPRKASAACKNTLSLNMVPPAPRHGIEATQADTASTLTAILTLTPSNRRSSTSYSPASRRGDESTIFFLSTA